jgi:hypothetical protein
MAKTPLEIASLARVPYSIREAHSRFQRARWRLPHDFAISPA